MTDETGQTDVNKAAARDVQGFAEVCELVRVSLDYPGIRPVRLLRALQQRLEELCTTDTRHFDCVVSRQIAGEVIAAAYAAPLEPSVQQRPATAIAPDPGVDYDAAARHRSQARGTRP